MFFFCLLSLSTPWSLLSFLPFVIFYFGPFSSSLSIFSFSLSSYLQSFFLCSSDGGLLLAVLSLQLLLFTRPHQPFFFLYPSNFSTNSVKRIPFLPCLFTPLLLPCSFCLLVTPRRVVRPSSSSVLTFTFLCESLMSSQPGFLPSTSRL
jgi:hypothetical protein